MEMESAVKTTLLFSTITAAVLFAAPAGAGGGGPAQLMPSYPHPSYCEQCFGHPEVSPPRRIVARRHLERHHVRTDATGEAPK
jgi:hypothetical protein